MKTHMILLAALVLATSTAAAQRCQYSVGYGLQIQKYIGGSWVNIQEGSFVPPGVAIRFHGWVSVGANGCGACCADIWFDYATGTICQLGLVHNWRHVGEMKPISAGEIWEWFSPAYVPDTYGVLGQFWIFEVQSGGHSEVYAPSQVCYVPCNGDVTGDLMVNVNDVLAVIRNWGTQHKGQCGDANHDGIVDPTDLIMVIGNWGPCY